MQCDKLNFGIIALSNDSSQYHQHIGKSLPILCHLSRTCRLKVRQFFHYSTIFWHRSSLMHAFRLISSPKRAPAMTGCIYVPSPQSPWCCSSFPGTPLVRSVPSLALYMSEDLAYRLWEQSVQLSMRLISNKYL